MIPSRNRAYQRELPTEEAIKIIIVCEGIRREGDYFSYFEDLDSRVAIKVIKPSPDADNSPTGLYNSFQRLLTIAPERGDAELVLEDGDEVWFVIDTDRWGDKIEQLRARTNAHPSFSRSAEQPLFRRFGFTTTFTFLAPTFQPVRTVKPGSLIWIR